MNLTKRVHILLWLLFALSPMAFAQTVVKGKVVDQSDEPLIGVSVAIKNTKVKTITNFDGEYSLNSVNPNDLLVFSYIGCETQEIKAGNRAIINVSLSDTSTELAQVVIVGYGQQKKINLTGAVASVKIDEAIAGRSIASASTALQGLIPGLSVTQKSGMAGNNSAELLIRGVGTINNAAPLIVVDDMPDVDINRINLDDVESISVLKDASASSVYGSRGANGVILIKTKSGKGQEKTKISFSGSYGWEYAAKSLGYMDDYSRSLALHRASKAATDMMEAGQTYKRGTIEQWMALGMIDEKRYPNTDWWDYIMRTGSIQNYNVSASGSNDKSNFYASIGYMTQDGLQINNTFDRYNVRFNFDYKVLPNVNTGARFDGNWSNFTYALANGFTAAGNMGDMQSAIAGIYPYDPELDVYGGVMAVGEDGTAYNPLEYFSNHLKNKDRQELNGSFYLDWQPLKGLIARVDYGLRYYNQFEKEADTPNRAYNFQTEEFTYRWYVAQNAGITNRTTTGYKTLLNARLNYNTKIGENHDLGAMFVYSEEYWFSRNLNASRQNRIHPSLSEIDAALTDAGTISNNGNSEMEGLRSYIGRLNYSAYDKYLLEVNFRVDGSSKFQPGHQYGFFPSAALGWRFSEENFVKALAENWLSNGKFRFSYGALGNNSAVGRTEQQEVLAMSNYIQGSEIAKGFVYRKMLNEELTWESTRVMNVGLDFNFLNNRLSTELDYYDRLTFDMIQQSQMSNLLTGAYEAPRANIGNLRNRGMEGNLTWRDKVAGFSYSVNLNASYNQSRLESWSEYLGRGAEYNGKRVFINMPYDYVYTYLDEGKLIQSYAETMDGIFLGVRPGDVRRYDINGDGRVDGNDQVVIKGANRSTPTTNFAMNIQLAWKGFDTSMLFQGTSGRKAYWINNLKVLEIPGRYATTWNHWTEPWTWDNRDGSWPRLGGISTNQTAMEYWLDDMSFVRMKNLMIGYTIPKKLLKKVYISTFRLYASTENLFTLTKFRGLDPEKTDSSDMYPLTRSFTLGANIDF
ncbi:MAG: TonB-dependent receptor SusC [Candidatus Ordinivivax streblomastigis]|uniref:TonB-dependent receptor SusC n=1 Tax=Candidatus Ordinivivax streblomastigis TaxID=2540710 RepID=A0A5M8NZU0_9BACT|nr:MAG: TonB-dependent receptor SusC [Candidatus Ordinivivax streblomastigis]